MAGVDGQAVRAQLLRRQQDWNYEKFATGAWCQAAGLSYFVHVPSLVQHIGETSTIWTSAGANGGRRAADFIPKIA